MTEEIKVQRFGLYDYEIGMEEDPEGQYVTYWSYNLLSVELEKLKEENARLKKLAQDLDGYTLHGGCESHRGLNKCTCGLTELRKGLKNEQRESS
jgi:hypothetical protein